MAVPRSAHFNADVDPDLLTALQTVGEGYAPYKVQFNSGYRPGDPRMHGQHGAVDVQLFDPKSGTALANYQDASTAAAYQQYAQAVYQWAQTNNPQLAEKMRWGGYFSGGQGKYGALDLMHFDVGGGPGGMGMAGGSWEKGWTPEMMDLWKMEKAGGVAPGTTEAYRQAFLDTIAGTESPGYDVLYGGGKFSDFSKHPNQAIPITTGPNAGQTSTAAGRYQFLAPTWAEQSKLSGVSDFSQASQDKVAWDYADPVYKEKTGGSLAEALQSGDAGRINAASQVLNQVWTSLPGGAEQAKGYGGKTFYDAYSENLKKAGQGATPYSYSGGTEAKPAADKPVAATPAARDGEQPKNLWDVAGNAVAGMNVGGGVKFGGAMPAPVAAARTDAPEVPQVVSMASPDRRQQLAQILANLNSGKLF